MKLLKDTFLFQFTDSSSNLKEKMTSYVASTDKLELKDIEEQLDVITKRFAFPLKNKVVADVTNGIVVPMYNKDKIKIPTFVPAYLYTYDGKVVSLVNLTTYGSRTKEGFFDIDPRQMFACLQTGSVAIGCYQNWNAISMNQTVAKLGALIYAKLFSKVLDKMYAVNLDPIKADKVRYAAAKFYLLNVLGKTQSESVDAYAYSTCANGTTKNTISAFEQTLPAKAYQRLDEFIHALSVSIEGASSLTIRTFIDTHIKLYGTSAIFSLEYFPYFCHMLFSVAVGAHLNAEYLIDSMVGKDLDKFYNEVANILR